MCKGLQGQRVVKGIVAGHEEHGRLHKRRERSEGPKEGLKLVKNETTVTRLVRILSTSWLNLLRYVMYGEVWCVRCVMRSVKASSNKKLLGSCF